MLLHLEKGVPIHRLGVFKFRIYLDGKLFFLHTNHQTLTLFNDAKFKNDRTMRWVLAFRQYEYTGKEIVIDSKELQTFCLICFVFF